MQFGVWRLCLPRGQRLSLQRGSFAISASAGFGRKAIRIYQCQDKKSRRGDETVISASPKSMQLSAWMNPRKSPCIHPGMGKHRLSLSQAPWNICSVCLIKPEMRFLPRSRATPRQSSCRANAGLGENDQWFNFLRTTGSRSTMLYKRS